MNQITQEDIARLQFGRCKDHTRTIRIVTGVAIAIVWIVAALCVVADMVWGK